ARRPVVVCSELDRTRLALPGVEVIGNGSVAPEVVHPDRRGLRGDAPSFLFVGALDYEPNSDAVEWFVRHVFPAVRRRVPDAQLRVVGRGAERVAWVAQVPGVELVGRAPEMQPELDRADVSLVPIRVGAGTRLKVVEALANRVPLMTTPVGCEGIDVTDGVDALITDDPVRFADDCVRLATDGELRQRLAEAGAELFAARYDWEIIERDLAALAVDVVQRHAARR
ncbi:MAG: glycosyltransferase family 4 protein, partial [Microthrixaceae bacterium]